jgi:glucose/mannose transport system substrate-binding protein
VVKTQIIGKTCAFGLMALGCSDLDSRSQHQKLELLTWWSQASELAAISAVIEVHRAKHPDIEVEVLQSQNQGSMTKDVQDRLVDGTPPSAFQANLGGNTLQWSETAQTLNGRAEAWSAVFRESILERVRSDGQLMAVPFALTRQNNAYYNVEILAELELDIPVGRAAFDAWLGQLVDLGYTHPLCLGDQSNWVSAHVLFEDVVPAYVGAEHSQKFWTGQLSADDARFAEALDYAATLNQYWNTDLAHIEWDAGVTRLMEHAAHPSEQCVMAPMGDWGGAVLAENNAVDEAFAQRSWPGAEDLFVLAGDAFITTKGVRNQASALDFLDTLASEAGQIAFNVKKGSVPARTISEEHRAKFGPLTQANMADLSSGAALAAYKVLGSSKFPWDALAELTHDFLLVGDKQPVIEFVAQHYDKLAQSP